MSQHGQIGILRPSLTGARSAKRIEATAFSLNGHGQIWRQVKKQKTDGWESEGRSGGNEDMLFRIALHVSKVDAVILPLHLERLKGRHKLICHCSILNKDITEYHRNVDVLPSYSCFAPDASGALSTPPAVAAAAAAGQHCLIRLYWCCKSPPL